VPEGGAGGGGGVRIHEGGGAAISEKKRRKRLGMRRLGRKKSLTGHNNKGGEGKFGKPPAACFKKRRTEGNSR